MTEYVFHYKLDGGNQHPRKDAAVELIRDQFRNLLNVIIPTHKGKELKVDGFKLLSDEVSIHNLEASEESPQSQSLGSVAIYEPRIELIKKQLESLLSVVELEVNGKPVKVDGFRLKNPSDWLISGSDDPNEILEYLASRCNCDCVMCYNKGTPPSLALKTDKRTATDEFNEIKTRLDYFSPSARTSLFPSIGISWDVTAHPYFMDTLQSLREKTTKPLRIATNGKTLTPQMVKELSNFKPLYIYLSLNSSSPQRRKRLMKDNKPQIAIAAPKLLRNETIPLI